MKDGKNKNPQAPTCTTAANRIKVGEANYEKLMAFIKEKPNQVWTDVSFPRDKTSIVWEGFKIVPHRLPSMAEINKV